MDKKLLVKNGYNKMAEKYLASRVVVEDVSLFLKEFASMIKEKDKVLDIGCGAGIPDTKFLSKKFEVIGIDFSEKQIELAKQNVPNAKFICKDMTELDFPENYFGGILANYSIIHVPREEHEGGPSCQRLPPRRGVGVGALQVRLQQSVVVRRLPHSHR